MEDIVQKLLKTIFGEDVKFEVRIEEDKYADSKLLIINSDSEIKPQIIGKSGSTIKAIHNIVNLIARRKGEKYFVKVSD